MTNKRPRTTDLADIDRAAFVQHLEGIYEDGRWVAEAYFARRKPDDFQSATQLAAALKATVEEATPAEQLMLMNSYPDLAGKAHLRGEVTDDSSQEHARAGLGSLTEEEMSEFTALNDAYRAKFGFVFILAVRNASKQIILQSFRRRIKNSRSAEAEECLRQIHKIAWMRLLSGFVWNLNTGFLTCHVLDTARGCPAAGMRVSLARVDDTTQRAHVIADFETDEDGRTGKALEGEAFVPGRYEWTFHAGPYFAKAGLPMDGMAFLDEVPIRFGIDNPEEHYHVPLLVSPWAFSTYRGS